MDKKPYIGQKDRRINVSTKTLVATNTGERKETIVLVSEAWAYVEDISGGEDVEGKIRSLYNRAYYVRYNAEFLTERRLLVIDGEKRFEVVYVSEMGRKDHLKLVCKLYE